jgi:hypothetical protein
MTVKYLSLKSATQRVKSCQSAGGFRIHTISFHANGFPIFDFAVAHSYMTSQSLNRTIVVVRPRPNVISKAYREYIRDCLLVCETTIRMLAAVVAAIILRGQTIEILLLRGLGPAPALSVSNREVGL